MSIRYIYFALLLLNYCSCAKYSHYCAKNKENTPCKFKGRMGADCGPVDFIPLKDFEREIILNKHNELRQAVADGMYAAQYLPSASDMNVLSWDKEAEFFAREQVKQCIFAHDVVRICLNGDELGQCITSSNYETNGMDKTYFEGNVQTWFDEIKHIDENFKGTIQEYHYNSSTAHLTQLLWAETNYVGCAKLFNLREGHRYDFTCDYREIGNRQGRSIYTIGKSTCAKPNSKYPALCGDIRSLADDKYVAPDKGEIYLCQHLVLITASFILYYSNKLWIL